MTVKPINLIIPIIVILGILLGFTLKQVSKARAQGPPEQKYTIIRSKPNFIKFPIVKKIRNSLGKVLTDIEEHMDYSYAAGDYHDPDQVTTAHETSHGISSVLRQKYRNRGKINAFYVLDNQAVILQEPPTTMRKVERLVPRSLMGMSYNLYMVQQAQSWNDESLYILDEFNAYTNGTAAGINLNLNRSESCQQMLEFAVYSICLAGAITNAKIDGETYDDQEFKQFLMWQIERAISYYQQTEDTNMASPKHEQYLNKFRTAKDAENLRVFTRGYFGKEWTTKYLGF